MGAMLRSNRLDGSNGRPVKGFGELSERVAGHVSREEQLPREEEVRLCPDDGSLEFLEVLRFVTASWIELGQRRVHGSVELGKGGSPRKSFCRHAGLRCSRASGDDNDPADARA